MKSWTSQQHIDVIIQSKNSLAFSPTWAWVSVLLLDIWQWTPFWFFVILAGLQSLSEEVYDAAISIHPPNRQIFRKITFPLIQP
jgi:multiple sugar transport system permease protein